MKFPDFKNTAWASKPRFEDDTFAAWLGSMGAACVSAMSSDSLPQAPVPAALPSLGPVCVLGFPCPQAVPRACSSWEHSSVPSLCLNLQSSTRGAGGASHRFRVEQEAQAGPDWGGGVGVWFQAF